MFKEGLIYMNNERQRSPLHLLWLDKYAKAMETMEKSEITGSGILIEVAAQHPLKDGMYPESFRK